VNADPKVEVIMKRIPIILAVAIIFVGALMSDGTNRSRKAVPQKAGFTAEARTAILTVNDDLKKLEKSHDGYVKAAGELDGLYIKLIQKVREVSRLAADAQKSRGSALEKLYRATQEMQEMSQGFNLQYLDLQQNMQRENRQFTLVSNIMKTKHDTAKNAINNVR
jgi:arginine decarboxylase-like protein